jgi:hypothetical protein
MIARSSALQDLRERLLCDVLGLVGVTRKVHESPAQAVVLGHEELLESGSRPLRQPSRMIFSTAAPRGGGRGRQVGTLVPPEQWQRVAERRKVTCEKWSRPRAPRRLLAGLLYCGDCERRAYYTAKGGDLPGRYRCSEGPPSTCRTPSGPVRGRAGSDGCLHLPLAHECVKPPEHGIRAVLPR